MNLWDALVAYEESRGYKGADAEEEVIARCCEQFLAKTTFVNSFASKHYKTARAISAFLTRMNADMQQLVADVNIDFVWGKEGKRGYGIAHIIEKRNAEDGSGLETVNKMVEVIAKAEKAVVQRSDDPNAQRRIKLFYDGYTAVLTKTTSSDNNWLLTGWRDKNTETSAYGEGNDSSVATAATTTRTRDSRDVPTNNSIPSTKDVVKQEITSAKTSIKQIPALFTNSNVKFGKTNIDIGGGRFDLATTYLAERGTKNMIFDPYNRDEAYNTKTLKFLQDGNKADTATCANVLNVIAEKEARANVILEVAKSIKQDGKAYFMVYEGDGSGVGKQTSAGYQNNRKTADYVGEIEEYFDTVTRKGKLIIAENPLPNLPKASWELSPGNGVRFSVKDNVSLTDKEYETKRDQYIEQIRLLERERNDAQAIMDEIEESDEYKDAFDRLLNAPRSEFKKQLSAYQKVLEQNPEYENAKKKTDLLDEQLKKLRDEADQLDYDKQEFDYQQGMKESGLTEAEYSRKLAIKEFGYTPYFYDAGYLLPNGKMLNFSGEKGKHYGTRGQDHRAIGTIYPHSQGSEAMIRFMNDGNIRVMAETPGLDLCSEVEPTNEQYAAIKRFAEESRRKEYFSVDLSDKNGDNVGTLEYDGNVNPTRIINDIKHFYATGEMREQSSVLQFHYSTMDKVRLSTSDGTRTYTLGDVTAKLYGNDVELDGGKVRQHVQMMEAIAEINGTARVDAASEEEAEAFRRAGAKREANVFGDTEYGTWAFEHKEDQYREDTQYDAKQKRNFADAVLKEVGTRKNFTKEDLRIIRARLEKAFAVLHNAWHGKGDQLVAMEYADKLFDAILNRKEKRRPGDVFGGGLLRSFRRGRGRNRRARRPRSGGRRGRCNRRDRRRGRGRRRSGR